MHVAGCTSSDEPQIDFLLHTVNSHVVAEGLS